MKIEVHNRCSDFSSYRAARVKSLFNAESGANFDLVADIPVEDDQWRIGVVVGPSGSGKSSIGRRVWGGDAMYDPTGWRDDAPVIDCIAPEGDFNAVTASLASVGLGSVPTWLRPYSALSNGEKFRADLAKIISEAPKRVVVDEFTSVVDRQIARIGALAFQKAWRRTGGQCILLSCHYDILEWLEPDWIFDTSKAVLARDRLQRPKFDLEIWETNGSYWDSFEPHHYLKLPRMVAASYYVGTVNGELVCHVATSPRFEINHMRACRLVVMPEWQGAGVGLRFLDYVCQAQLDGGNRWGRKVKGVLFHTSHPGLAASLRRSKKWRQVSAELFGGNKKKSAKSIKNSPTSFAKAGYGGHFRAVQGSAMWDSLSRVYVYPTGEGAEPALAAAVRAVEAAGMALAAEPAGSWVAIAPLLTRKLSAEEISLPELGTLIFHPSLLPRWRGKRSIRAAFEAGETYTGATIFWANAVLDGGDICEQAVLEIIKGETPREFYGRAAVPTIELLFTRALTDIRRGVVRRIPQRHEAATFC